MSVKRQQTLSTQTLNTWELSAIECAVRDNIAQGHLEEGNGKALLLKLEAADNIRLFRSPKPWDD